MFRFPTKSEQKWSCDEIKNVLSHKKQGQKVTSEVKSSSSVSRWMRIWV
jgi:hypothetical protein